MGVNSKIEWTDATWNPVTGCTPVSEGCKNCYAKRMAYRLRGRFGYPADNPFRVTLHPERLNEPLCWKKPRRVFVNSMGDLFHENVPFGYIDEVIQNMFFASQHTFLVLTKRPDQVLEYVRWRSSTDPVLTSDRVLPPNMWLGVTAENQKAADERIPILLQTPAAVRFVSVEPMLGPVDLENVQFDKWTRMNVLEGCGVTTRPGVMGQMLPNCFSEKLSWVICGGETGPNARPMHPDWVRSLRDQCQASETPFFFKSWGEWLPGKWYADSESDMTIFLENGTDINLNDKFDGEDVRRDQWVEKYCHIIPGTRRAYWCDPLECYEGECMIRLGKKAAGRILDGQTWDEYPKLNLSQNAPLATSLGVKKGEN